MIKELWKYIKIFLKYYVLFYFVSSLVFIPVILLMFRESELPIFMFVVGLIISMGYFAFVYKLKHNFSKEEWNVYVYSFFVFVMTITLCMFISQGRFVHPIWSILYIVIAPFIPLMFFLQFSGLYIESIIVVIFIMCMNICFYYKSLKPQINIRKMIGLLGCIVCMIGLNSYIYITNSSKKYVGHGFEYMNGFSSTNLVMYDVTKEYDYLVELKEPSQFIIEDEKDMPILDGAEACYPVYNAVAKAVYSNIKEIEQKNRHDYEYTNGKIVSFTNTSVGYTRLINGEVDMFFGAKPSPSQIEEAKQQGVEFEFTPIGKEAFVFFVNENNPIDSLTSKQIKDIYHGSITNWKEVGGENHKILPFQRPERSGSQSMMIHFMGDVSLKDPLTYEMISGMGGIIEEVAKYENDKGAIGYTFKYFLEGLNQEKNVKILKVDDVYPTSENIKDNSYPISGYLYCVTLKSNKKENVKKLKDFLLSDQGQYIIEETGYCALKKEK